MWKTLKFYRIIIGISQCELKFFLKKENLELKQKLSEKDQIPGEQLYQSS